MELRLKQQEEEVNINDDNFLNAMESLESFLSKNSEDSKKRLIEAIINAEAKKSYSLDSSKREQLADKILTAVHNNVKKLEGRQNGVRFQPELIRAGMALWLDAGSAYDTYREHSLEVLPSVDTLQRWKKELAVKEGINPKIYGWFADGQGQIPPGQQLDGHLMFDEMKLRSNIYWNCKDDSVVGFASNKDGRLCLEEVINDVLTVDTDGEEDDEDQSLSTNIAEDDPNERALYVNLFRLRTTTGNTYNCEFFFNTSSLSGDDLVAQVIHVILCLESVVSVGICHISHQPAPWQVIIISWRMH